MINITLTEIITSFTMYGIIHAAWTAIKWGLKHLETEAGQVIETHVKAGHRSRLERCIEDDCARLGTERGLIRRVGSTLEH